MKINVHSEIGQLKKVLLHRPGHELENLTPNLLERLLFDDIPYLKVAQEEHDGFAELLRKNGVEVFYLAELVAESLHSGEARSNFLNLFLQEAGISNAKHIASISDYLCSLTDNKAIADKLISGIRKDEVEYHDKSLAAFIYRDYPMICDGLPNSYFTRDPFSCIGHGITVNHMHTKARKRESLLIKQIFEHHPLFRDENIPFWYQRENDYSIEGGDILVLSEETIAVGISQRTQAQAVEKLARTLLLSNESKVKTVLAFKIPESRAFMHLDTVFTQIDKDAFTIHNEIEGPLEVYVITGSNQHLDFTFELNKLDDTLQRYLGVPINLIRCGGGDVINAGREQWNDGSNTLAIAPGEVIVYERNYVTNAILKEHGIKVHELKGSELSRGRGGPRCMSMPLQRDAI